VDLFINCSFGDPSDYKVWQVDFGCKLFVVSDDFDILENRRSNSGFSMMAGIG
jgi:hypothetical protein